MADIQRFIIVILTADKEERERRKKAADPFRKEGHS